MSQFYCKHIMESTIYNPTLQKQIGNSNPFFGVKILAAQITHSLSWNASGIIVDEIPSIFYG